MENDESDVEQDEFCIGEDSITILDRYLGGEELKELILEEGMFSTIICHKGPRGLMSSTIFNLKNINIPFRMYFIMPLQPLE